MSATERNDELDSVYEAIHRCARAAEVEFAVLRAAFGDLAEWAALEMINDARAQGRDPL